MAKHGNFFPPAGHFCVAESAHVYRSFCRSHIIGTLAKKGSEEILSQLAGDRDQNENVNPQRGHEVPIPGSDVDDDALPLHYEMPHSCECGIQESNNSASKMYGVHSSEQVKERTARR